MSLTVVWSLQAQRQFLATLTYIAKEDPQVAALVQQRMQKSLQLLSGSPEIGVAAAPLGLRTYAVPRTGHSFDYRLIGDQIRVQRWYRQRQKPAETQ